MLRRKHESNKVSTIMDYVTTHLASIKCTTDLGYKAQEILQKTTTHFLESGAEFSRSPYHVPATRRLGSDGKVTRFDYLDDHYHLYSYSVFASPDSVEVLEGKVWLQ